jgi:glycosyltransferase involved in cell wall biosynthesis
MRLGKSSMQGPQANSMKFTSLPPMKRPPGVLQFFRSLGSTWQGNRARRDGDLASQTRFPHSEFIEPLETRQALGLMPKDIVIGYIGRSPEAQNHNFILEILTEAHRMNSHVRLLLVGGGLIRLNLEERAIALGLHSLIVFTSALLDASQRLQAMDVLAVPSKGQIPDLAVLKAQAAGLPCVIAANITTKAVVIDSLVTRLPAESAAHAWAATLLERAAESRSASENFSFNKNASLERLAAIYRTTQ